MNRNIHKVIILFLILLESVVALSVKGDNLYQRIETRSLCVYSLYKDHTGLLWVGTSKGLMTYPQLLSSNPTAYKRPHDLSIIIQQILTVFDFKSRKRAFYAFPASSGRIVDVARAGGRMYVVTTRHLFTASLQGGCVSCHVLTSLPEPIDYDPKIQFATDSRQNIWLRGNGKLMRYDVAHRQWKTYGDVAPDIMGIERDAAGKIVVATSNHGLYVFDAYGNFCQQIEQTAPLVNGLSSNHIQSLYADPQTRTIFIGYHKSSFSLLHSAGNQSRLIHIQDERNHYVSEDVISLFPTKNGTFWAGTEDNGVYEVDALASCWLYQATGDKTYLDKAKDYATHFGKEFQGGTETSYSWPICWDDVHLGACMKLAELTGDETYAKPIENMIDYWNGRNGVKGSNPINRTQGGLPVMSNWGSIRYAAGAAFMGEVYAKWSKAKADYKQAANEFAQTVTNYVLGSSGQVFHVGYGTNYPTHEHHRTAHGSWNNNMADLPDENRHVLQGAVVGGPSSGDDSSYKDVRNNYETNEVACDYNACYTGMVAAVFENNGVKKVADPSAIETPDGKEFFVESGINCQDSQNQTNFVELKIIVRNHTAWPARVSDKLHVRVYYDISDVLKAGKTANDFTTQSNYAQKPVKISKLLPTGKDGIYYVDLDLTGDKIMPGGQDPSRCEIQFRVSGPQGVKWDYMKSPSGQQPSSWPYGRQVVGRNSEKSYPLIFTNIYLSC
ncbi:glycoside hydrolase family 9 protein [Prevotella sp. AGR2160]|uniref:glycoside hydrolase family 9 protein n=1 Tax=Prevotella sp. AGR2160 TaxID=1280674 RepID=UPI00042065EE|nr:glycoside hydrolase family 9 protein [Prevotella sp. AGR2160]